MRNKVQSYLSSLGVEQAKPCKVILAHSTAHEETIQDILKLAAEYQSPWVIVSSHGRSGLSRLAFGSFAEALVMQSKCPILFLPRAHHDNAEINHLLFPTDFSSASHSAFRRLLEEARSARMKITLYYSNVWPASSFAGMDVPVALPPGFLEEEEKKARAEADRWIFEASERDVEVEFKCSNDGGCFDVGRSILEAANTLDAGIISMSCGSRSIATFIEGSIARDVFRTNEFPVLVYGPLSTTS
jgi:nucleotide-binding universal stress UspA family protein